MPAYLRKCAPWLGPDEVRRLQRADAQAWTVSDLPLLDAARQRLGDPEASRRKRRHDAAVAAERERMASVVDDLIEADDDGDGLVTMLRDEDLRDALVDEAALPGADPDLLAGPFAHVVVDEAQELTDAEWQMLLLRCPSRSFTIVGDRAQARHGFTESWQERLERIGLDRISLASLSINYRTPEEVMAEAEPVIRAVLPDANVPTSIRSSGVPVVHGSASELGSILDTWLAAHAEGIACVIGDPHVPADVPRPVADPGAVEGARVRPGRPRRPGGVRHGHRRSGRPLRRDDPSDPAARHPHELLTSRREGLSSLVGLVAVAGAVVATEDVHTRVAGRRHTGLVRDHRPYSSSSSVRHAHHASLLTFRTAETPIRDRAATSARPRRRRSTPGDLNARGSGGYARALVLDLGGAQLGDHTLDLTDRLGLVVTEGQQIRLQGMPGHFQLGIREVDRVHAPNARAWEPRSRGHDPRLTRKLPADRGVSSLSGMAFSWDDSRQAFTDAAQWFLRTTALVGDRWTQPGLGEWDVRALVGHTSRSLLTVEAYVARPATTAEIISPADYFRASRAAAAGPAVAARGRDAGAALGSDPAAASPRSPNACSHSSTPRTAANS